MSKGLILKEYMLNMLNVANETVAFGLQKNTTDATHLS